MRPLLRLLVLACALLLVACNTGPATESTQPDATEASEPDVAPTGTDQEALDRIAQAAETTTEAGTSRFEITLETAGTQGSDGEQPLTVEGEEDFTAEQRRMTFRGPGGELEMIVDGTDVYVEIPATEDEQWARIELDDLVGDDVGFGGPGGLPFQSPQDNLEMLSENVTGASEGDTEDVRDESTTRYDLTIDLESASGELEDGNATFQRLADESGVTELDMQVWIDDEDHIRRIAYSLDVSQAEVDTDEVEGAEVEAEPAGTVTMTVEYFDFGTTVDIQIPDDDRIVDVDEEEIRGSMPQDPGAGSGSTDDDITAPPSPSPSG